MDHLTQTIQDLSINSANLLIQKNKIIEEQKELIEDLLEQLNELKGSEPDADTRSE